MKKFLPIFIVIMGIVVGAFIWSMFRSEERPTVKEYRNADLHITFTYPSEYVLEEKILDMKKHRAIILMRAHDAENIPVNGEGPPTITIDVYENTKNLSVLAWATTSSASNFKLGDEAHTEETVAKVPAIRFQWSGLYEGDTVAFAHTGWIIAASVTYLTREDHIRQDFESILSSFQTTP